LARLPKSGDKRVTNITLTSAGDELLKRTPDLLQQRLAAKLKRLSEDELLKMSGALQLLTDMLEISDSEAADEFPVISADGIFDVE
jgi:DNA-binding MarR family transcriptional regulator